MSEGRQTVAGAYAKLKEHEIDCARRYELLDFKIGLVLKVLAWGGPVAAAVLVGVAGWGLNQVFENQDAQLRELREMKAQVAAVRAR